MRIQRENELLGKIIEYSPHIFFYKKAKDVY